MTRPRPANRSTSPACCTRSAKTCVAAGFVGGDSGRFIRADLDRAGVAHDLVTVIPKTRMCVTIIDRSTDAATELVQESKEVDKPAWGEAARAGGRAAAAGEGAGAVRVAAAGRTAGFLWVLRQSRDRVRGQHDRRRRRRAAAAGAGGQAARREAEPQRAGEDARHADRIGRGVPRRDQAARRDGAGVGVVTEGKDGAVVSDGEKFWRVPARRR